MSEKKQSPSRRHTRYIQRRFQTAFIVRFCLVALGAMALASIILFLLTQDTLTTTFAASELSVRETSWVVNNRTEP